MIIELFFKGNMFYFIFFISVLQFVVILESVLAKLSRYDEGTLFSSFLSFTVRTILAEFINKLRQF